jgi:hypothetical protein
VGRRTIHKCEFGFVQQAQTKPCETTIQEARIVSLGHEYKQTLLFDIHSLCSIHTDCLSAFDPPIWEKVGGVDHSTNIVIYY